MKTLTSIALRTMMYVFTVAAFAGCASIERFTDRQRRLYHYRQVARALPDFVTQKELYAVLPPILPPRPLPYLLSIAGGMELKSEVYLVDEDCEVRVDYSRAPEQWRVWREGVEIGPRRDWLTSAWLAKVALPSKTPFDSSNYERAAYLTAYEFVYRQTYSGSGGRTRIWSNRNPSAAEEQGEAAGRGAAFVDEMNDQMRIDAIKLRRRMPYIFRGLPETAAGDFECTKCGTLLGGVGFYGPSYVLPAKAAKSCIHDWARVPTRREFIRRARERFPDIQALFYL